MQLSLKTFIVITLCLLFQSQMLFADNNELETGNESPSLISILPEDNSFVNSLEVGQTISFKTNFDSSCGGFKVSIIDQSTNNTLYEDFTTYYKDGLWSLEIFEVINFEKGHNYTVQLEGHASGSSKSETVATVTATYKGGTPSLKITPSDGKYERLDHFVFACEDGIEKVEGNCVKIYAEDKTSLIEELAISQENNTFKATLSSPIEVDGKYFLYIPSGCFMLSEKYPNNEIWMEYTISTSKDAAYYHVTLDPKEGSTLSKLEKISITFNDMGRWGENETQTAVGQYKYAPYVINMNGDIVSECTREKVRDSICSITLKTPIKKSGTYKLVIPQGAFILGDWGIHTNDFMEFEYIVEAGADPGDDRTVTPADNSTVTLLKDITIRFNKIKYTDAKLNAEKSYVKDNQGNIVAYGSLKWGAMQNELILSLENEISQAGIYYITIPAESCVLDGETYQKDIYLTYTIPGASGIDNILNVERQHEQFDLLGRKVNKMKKGNMYIVNGKKFIKE